MDTRRNRLGVLVTACIREPVSYALCAVFLTGLALIAISLLIPEFKAGMPLPSEINPYDAEGNFLPDLERYTREFHARLQAARTIKWKVEHGGEILVSLSVCLTAVAAIARMRLTPEKSIWQALPSATTPGNSLAILALGALVMIYEIPWTYQHFARLVAEGCCPIWADSLGPAIYGVPEGVIALVAILLPLGYFLFLFRSRLPAPIFIWSREHPYASWIYTLLVAPFAAVSLYYGFHPSHADALKVPQVLLALWVILCARAAGISRHVSRV